MGVHFLVLFGIMQNTAINMLEGESR